MDSLANSRKKSKLKCKICLAKQMKLYISVKYEVQIIFQTVKQKDKRQRDAQDRDERSHILSSRKDEVKKLSKKYENFPELKNMSLQNEYPKQASKTPLLKQITVEFQSPNS